MTPKFSVVIPTHNSSDHIRRTLSSVVMQSTSDYEIVIVDDMSDDVEALERVVSSFEFSNASIKLFLSDHKLNGAGARNRAIEMSSGEFICFLDSDDEWTPHKLRAVEREISKFDSENLNKIVFFSSVSIYSDGAHVKNLPVRPISNSESLAQYIFGHGGFIQTSSIVIRRELALLVKFNEEFKRHQDFDFCIRASKLGCAFHFIPEALVKYHLSAKASRKLKGESGAYSSFWLRAMSPFLNFKDIASYNAFRRPSRLVDDGHYFRAIYFFCVFFPLTSWRGKKDLLLRLIHIKAYGSNSNLPSQAGAYPDE